MPVHIHAWQKEYVGQELQREANCIRMEYLKAVLRQEVGYFDTNATSSTSFKVISTISSDAHIIQDTIAEKVFYCLRNTLFLFYMLL